MTLNSYTFQNESGLAPLLSLSRAAALIVKDSGADENQKNMIGENAPC
jgi:hypothetical protein